MVIHTPFPCPPSRPDRSRRSVVGSPTVRPSLSPNIHVERTKKIKLGKESVRSPNLRLPAFSSEDDTREGWGGTVGMTRLLDLTTLLLLSPHLHLSFLSLLQLPFRHPTGCVFLSDLRDAPVHVMVTRKSRIDWLATSLVYEKVSDLEAILALPGLLPNRRPQNLLSYRLFDLGEHSKSRSSAPGSGSYISAISMAC